jgi:hypothetical protein
LPESRLDRIERLTEQNTIAIGQLTAQMAANNAQVAADIAATNIELRASHLMVNEKFKEMAEAQTAMLRTLDRLAKLWERSPN